MARTAPPRTDHRGPRVAAPSGRRRPPGPRGGLAALANFQHDRLRFFTGIGRDFGDVAWFRIRPYEVFVVSHPDLIGEVLVRRQRRFIKARGLREAKRVLGEGLLTSEGGFHKRQRRLIQPIFHHERIAGYGEAMVEHAARMADRWRPGTVVDVHEQMSRLTLAVAAQSLLGTDLDEESEDAALVGRALGEVMPAFERVTLPFLDVLEKLPVPTTIRLRRGVRALDDVMGRMIRRRRADAAAGDDLLSLLLRARDEGGTGMTDRQVRDEAMTIFLAGHETTAVALSWTWYLLSRHPRVAARLHEELDRVLGGRLPTVEDVAALRYTEMVLSESMRLFPPAWILGREATEDMELAGWEVPNGATVLTPPWVVHRDPRWWPEPRAFGPERWAEEDRSRPRYSYIPFGAGTRICIGEHFAWMEGVLLLATLARRWRPRLVPGHPVVPRPLITLRPRYGIRMSLEPR